MGRGSEERRDPLTARTAPAGGHAVLVAIDGEDVNCRWQLSGAREERARFPAAALEHDAHPPEECDAWVCVCGNSALADGFVACDARGQEVAPTEAEWTSGLLRCERCGRMAERSMRIIARRLDLSGVSRSQHPVGWEVDAATCGCVFHRIARGELDDLARRQEQGQLIPVYSEP